MIYFNMQSYLDGCFTREICSFTVLVRGNLAQYAKMINSKILRCRAQDQVLNFMKTCQILIFCHVQSDAFAREGRSFTLLLLFYLQALFLPGKAMGISGKAFGLCWLMNEHLLLVKINVNNVKCSMPIYLKRSLVMLQVFGAIAQMFFLHFSLNSFMQREELKNLK